MSKKIIYVTLIVMMSFFTIFAQNNVMAAKKENKVYTISKKSKSIDVGSHLYSTYGSDYVNKYTRDWYLFRSYLEKLEVSGGGKLIVKKEHIILQIHFVFRQMSKLYLKMVL